MTHLTQSNTWQQLSQNAAALPHMRELFAQNPSRFEQLSVKDCGLLLDYSKNLIISRCSGFFMPVKGFFKASLLL